MKVCITGPDHMTKMAAIPKYGKKTLQNLLKNRRSYGLLLGMQYRGLKFYKVCINDDPGLTLTYFTASSN